MKMTEFAGTNTQTHSHEKTRQQWDNEKGGYLQIENRLSYEYIQTNT